MAFIVTRMVIQVELTVTTLLHDGCEADVLIYQRRRRVHLDARRLLLLLSIELHWPPHDH